MRHAMVRCATVSIMSQSATHSFFYLPPLFMVNCSAKTKTLLKKNDKLFKQFSGDQLAPRFLLLKWLKIVRCTWNGFCEMRSFCFCFAWSFFFIFFCYLFCFALFCLNGVVWKLDGFYYHKIANCAKWEQRYWSNE